MTWPNARETHELRLYVTKQLQIDFDIGYLLFKYVHQQMFVLK
jgi:hypothetical protein